MSFMIDEFPAFFSASFNAIKPGSMDKFFEIASRAEADPEMRISNRKRQIDQPRNNYPAKKRKLPSPSKICESKGFMNRFHRADQCQNRDSKFQYQTFHFNANAAPGQSKTQLKLLNLQGLDNQISSE